MRKISRHNAKLSVQAFNNITTKSNIVFNHCYIIQESALRNMLESLPDTTNGGITLIRGLNEGRAHIYLSASNFPVSQSGNLASGTDVEILYDNQASGDFTNMFVFESTPASYNDIDPNSDLRNSISPAIYYPKEEGKNMVEAFINLSLKEKNQAYYSHIFTIERMFIENLLNYGPFPNNPKYRRGLAFYPALFPTLNPNKFLTFVVVACYFELNNKIL